MRKRNKKAIGALPGTVVFTGEQKLEHPDIHFIRYDENELSAKHISNGVHFACTSAAENEVIWYDVRGLHDVSTIEDISKNYHLHPLVIEDIVSIGQRPKFEEYDNGLFIVVQAFRFYKETLSFSQEQVSIFVGANFVLSFQEDEEDLFLNVRAHLDASKTKVQRKKADYLAYMLLDTIVDEYLALLDDTEDEIEKLETMVTLNPNPSIKSKIYHLKREMLSIRKAAASLREAISKLMKTESTLINPYMNVYLRDLYDHCAHAVERAENTRDSLTDLQNLYLAEISFKMNGVIQLLTIISAIFIPLTFIAGLYGMNFETMPELKHPYGYYTVLCVMLLIVVFQIWYFKRKKWL